MRKRLWLSFFIVIFIAIVTILFVMQQSAISQVRNFMFRGGMIGLDSLVNSVEKYYADTGSWDGVSEFLEAPMMRQDNNKGMMGRSKMVHGIDQQLKLADSDGYIIFDFENNNPSGKITDQEISKAIPLKQSSKIVGYLIPEVGVMFTNANEQLLIQRLNQAGITAALISASVALVLALLISRGLVKPIKALTNAATMISEGDLTQRVDIQSNDELNVLAIAFNKMAQSLNKADIGRKAMTADIAHELRTPLSVQQANIEALIDGIYPLTIDNLQPLVDQNILLTRLVDDLQTLAMVDAKAIELEMDDIDLLNTIHQVVQRYSPEAGKQSISIIEEHSTSPIWIKADHHRIEQILGNLLSNAVRYTPTNGKVYITTSMMNDHVNIKIRDTGLGIPEDSIPLIFDRFYKADKSRSRYGSGLGLSIAKKLVEAHNGDIQASNHPEGGALFIIQLPVHT